VAPAPALTTVEQPLGMAALPNQERASHGWRVSHKALFNAWFGLVVILAYMSSWPCPHPGLRPIVRHRRCGSLTLTPWGGDFVLSTI
jgi:hypothetical protein